MSCNVLINHSQSDCSNYGTLSKTNERQNLSEKDPLMTSESSVEIKVYKRRFWILGIFSFIVFANFIVWGTFGPIINSVEYAYQWRDWYIALIEDWGCLNTIPFMIPLSLFNHKYGLRKGVLLTIILMTLGTAARCVTTNDLAFTYIASFAAIADGAASCLTQSLPSMISSTWFPPTERTTATAISILVSQLSSTVMYLSPLIVRNPPEEPVTTLSPTVDFSSAESSNYVNISTEVPNFDVPLTREDIKSDIQTLMIIHFGMCFILLLCVFLYFPDKPPKPPSRSSSEERIDYKNSLKLIIRNRNFLLVMAAFISLNTFPVIWFSVMNFSLHCIGINQETTMYIAIIASLVAAVTSLFTARLADYLQGQMKYTATGLTFVAAAFFFWFLLITEGMIVPSSNVQVYVAIIGGISASYAALPILFELTAELAYPCPESFVGAVMIFCNDSTGSIFLLVMMIPTECFRWLSYALAFGVLGTIIPLLLAKEERKRACIDGGYLPEQL